MEFSDPLASPGIFANFATSFARISSHLTGVSARPYPVYSCVLPVSLAGVSAGVDSSFGSGRSCLELFPQPDGATSAKSADATTMRMS